MREIFANFSLLCAMLVKIALVTGIGPGIAAVVALENPKARAYVFRWAKCLGMPIFGGTRKGQPCKVLIRGGRNSCLIEFPDGLQAVTSRNALRKAKA